MPNPSRVLVLGSEGHGAGVRAHDWHRVPKGLNVADYDAVILNFAALAENEALRVNVSLDHIPGIEQFVRLLFSADSSIIAFGDPKLQFGETKQRDIGGFADSRFSYLHATWWVPCALPTRADGGEVIRDVDSDWEFWFDRVRRYSWAFWRGPERSHDNFKMTSALEAAPPGTEVLYPRFMPLAETRTGEPIAIEVEFQAVRQGGSTPMGRQATETLATSSPFVWLPPPTEINHREAVDLLLRHVLGVHAEAPTPDWLERYSLPREAAAKNEVAKKSAEARTAAEAQRQAELVAVHESRFGKLLYEQGKQALEGVVREALSELGATVVPPAREGIEDGRLIDPRGRAAMLEIKGKAGQLGLEDVRQLGGWMQDALAEEEWKGKGIVIANVRLGEPPDRRKDLVGSNALPFARNIGVCIVTGAQLYEALRMNQNGDLDREAFWDAIFDTDGLAELPEPRPSRERAGASANGHG